MFGDASLAVSAFARLRYYDLAALRPLSEFQLLHAREVGAATALATTVNAYAKLSLPDFALFSAVSDALRAPGVLEGLSPQGVANVAHAYAKLGIQETDLFTLLARSVIQDIASYDEQSLAIVAFSFAKVHFAHFDKRIP